MKCPECKKEGVIIAVLDHLECKDCGSDVNIQYCFCPLCGYSFRTNNDEFLDGENVDFESLQAVDDMLNDFVASMEEEPSSPSKLVDLLHKCIRCDCPSAYKKNGYTYACPECGFEWEMLQNE